jgi:hypothetical protein
MLRRSEVLAVSGLTSLRRRPFRYGSLALACFALAAAGPPAPYAAQRRPPPAPEVLWKAFPLDPPGQDLRAAAPGLPRSATKAVPTASEAPSAGSPSYLIFAVAFGGLALLGALVVVSRASVELGHVNRPRQHVASVLHRTAALAAVIGAEAGRLLDLPRRMPSAARFSFRGAIRSVVELTREHAGALGVALFACMLGVAAGLLATRVFR